MKSIALAGVLLLALGIVALVYQGITYTSRETVIDLGPLHATADRQKTLPPAPGPEPVYAFVPAGTSGVVALRSESVSGKPCFPS